ncbi:MAG: exo-alpha-sialidase [Burkholderiaceae bacterium]
MDPNAVDATLGQRCIENQILKHKRIIFSPASSREMKGCKVKIRLLFTAPLLASLLFCCGFAAAHEEGHMHGDAKSNPEKRWADKLAAEPTLAMSVAFDSHGRLWRASVKERHVMVDYSDDDGKTFSMPVTVNANQESIGAEGDSRPKIAIGKKGELFISWTRALDKPYSGDIRFARSVDGGKTFSEPITINDNREVISHRFDSLAVGGDGRVYLVWLDKRDLSIAKKKHEPYDGSALYYAVSEDGGATFPMNKKIADHSCDCCRIALAVPTTGAPAIFWRHVYPGNVRDHAFTRLDGSNEVRRVSHDGWKIEACPHHGPALSVARDGVYHFAWFDNAPQANGLFYAHSTDGGKTFSAPLTFGNNDRQPGHADMLSLGSEVWLTWKEFDGEQSLLYAMSSHDGGTTWSAPQKIAATSDASDHPLLVSHAGHAFLSWNTARDGYRLIRLNGDAK